MLITPQHQFNFVRKKPFGGDPADLLLVELYDVGTLVHVGEEVLPVSVLPISVAKEYSVLYALALGIIRIVEMVIEASNWVRFVRWAGVRPVSAEEPRELECQRLRRRPSIPRCHSFEHVALDNDLIGHGSCSI